MVIFTIGTYGVNSLILGWCGSVCGQTKEKKSAAIAIVTTIMNISFICKSQKSGLQNFRLGRTGAKELMFTFGPLMTAWPSFAVTSR